MKKTVLPRWVLSAADLTGDSEKFCLQCHERISVPLEHRYKNAQAARIDIIAYIGDYKGEELLDRSAGVNVESGFHESKNDALKELQTIAAFHDCSIIEDLRFSEKSVRSADSAAGEGPLPFTERRSSLWSARGLALKLVDGK